MNLTDAIGVHQNSLLQLYRKLEKRFAENSVIRTLWHDMAGDISSQIQSLAALPPSLWNEFKNASDDDFESAIKNISLPLPDLTDISLRDGFEISLQLTEPVVLKIYSRVVGSLRKNSTAQSLNFYMLVKTYITRLIRTTESFAGDPMLTNRAQMLLQRLEKEIQDSVRESKKPPNDAAPKPAKTVASKPSKAVPVSAKTKTLPGKTLVSAKRA